MAGLCCGQPRQVDFASGAVYRAVVDISIADTKTGMPAKVAVWLDLDVEACSPRNII